jgi:hypothetical protein
MSRIKKIIFSFVTIFLIAPTTVFAINPYFVQKHESIGAIFRGVIFDNIFGLPLIFGILAIVAIPVIIAGYFIPRKYIGYLFFLVYPVIFFIRILAQKNERISDILLGNITLLYVAVLSTLLMFFISTYVAKIKNKRQDISNKDYIPLIIMAVLVFILFLLPIKSGHMVCKTPFVNKSFNCDYYLKGENGSWFTF